MSKIFDLNNVPDFKNKRVVLVGGYFDLLHAGHVSFLEKCREYGEVLVVAVNSDWRAKIKGPSRPIISEKDRLYLVSKLEVVDFCFLSDYRYDQEDGMLVKKIGASVVVFSDDQSNSLKTMMHSEGEKENSEKKNQEKSFLEENMPHIEIVTIPRQRLDLSTSQIIEKIVAQSRVKE